MPEELQQAIVIANFGHEILIQDIAGQERRATTRTKLPALVSGDRVMWRETPQHDAVIESLTPRTSLLTRAKANLESKPIVSNIDAVLITCTKKPAYRLGLIDRYLAACELANITPYIVFNKLDLINDNKLRIIKTELAEYEKIGYPVFYVSAKQTLGLDTLKSVLDEKNLVLVGQSGVGKSSLIKTLVPHANPKVASVSEATQKGRHTTTHSTLYMLDKQHYIIDSPGIREFGLSPVEPHVLAQCFVEFTPYLGQCRFRDCTHHSEPGCAVINAVQQNEISERRWQSYHAIIASFNAH